MYIFTLKYMLCIYYTQKKLICQEKHSYFDCSNKNKLIFLKSDIFLYNFISYVFYLNFLYNPTNVAIVP